MITDAYKYGEHIPLTCKNHRDKRWSTKNIDFIGARTIFYNLYSDPNLGPECDCPHSCLEVVLPEESQ